MCTHEETYVVLDMPMCDEDFNFVGRFDVTRCVECGENLSREPTTVVPSGENAAREVSP
jgi:hypothetical protein